MRRLLIALAVVTLAGVGFYTLMCGAHVKLCGGSSSQKAEAPAGRVAGNFDPAMSGVCRFACATKLKYKDTDVVQRPGAIPDRLTQCPVSGVVFAVDTGRPAVEVSGKEYVACCGNCAAKLRADPAHYLRS